MLKKKLFTVITAGLITSNAFAGASLLNTSYDIARELFATINPAFIIDYKEKTGKDVTVKQSHAGTSKQARSILQGLQADLVTFNQVKDIQVLADNGFVNKNWQSRLANNASPYYSLPAFLVRSGNPKNITSWADLARSDVDVVFPNPKTSGNARYTYLSAYAYAVEKFGKGQQADDFVSKVFSRVKVFDTGGRGATTTFTDRQLGDVLVTFEAEVMNIISTEGADKYERIVPKASLKAEFPVSVVDKIAKKKGTYKEATAYVNFLYSKKGQEIIAKFNNRVNHPVISKKYAKNFPDVRLIQVKKFFGGWDAVKKEHFAKGAKLDTIFKNRRKFK